MNTDYCPRTVTSNYPVRSSLARAVLTKIDNDRCLKQIDRNQWYLLSRPELIDDQYRHSFDKFHEDQDTKLFIKQSEDKSDSIFMQIIQSFLLTLLTLFMSRTSG